MFTGSKKSSDKPTNLPYPCIRYYRGIDLKENNIYIFLQMNKNEAIVLYSDFPSVFPVGKIFDPSKQLGDLHNYADYDGEVTLSNIVL